MKIFDAYKESVKKLLTAAGSDLEFSKHLCGTIANATVIAKKYPNRFKIVTLDGDIIATNGLLKVVLGKLIEKFYMDISTSEIVSFGTLNRL